MNDYQRMRAMEAKLVDYFQAEGWSIDNFTPHTRAYQGETDELGEEISIEVNLTELAKLVIEGQTGEQT